MLLPARSSRRHTVRTKCCFLPAPPLTAALHPVRSSGTKSILRRRAQSVSADPRWQAVRWRSSRKPTIRNGGQGYGTEFQSEIWNEFRHSNSSLGASKRLRDLESSLGERLQNSRNLVLLKAVRWRASRCCVVRMPFSAPPLPGGWALDWGRARTGEEIGWSAKRSHARRGSTHRAERLRRRRGGGPARLWDGRRVPGPLRGS